ncbi:hypothetical protein L873DRAFT_1847889 [Choiromyces venosus 120613-1]|uniref:Uncharacterized protein n=1 Tax=Choiromyces venosus 120613-1 TaxID=1336337 RepID=A0A3N4J4Y9_9PEZI|nr:hypothetical protein L873DRAFT_1847889 [Choiromyces venosus 120613-1]
MVVIMTDCDLTMTPTWLLPLQELLLNAEERKWWKWINLTFASPCVSLCALDRLVAQAGGKIGKGIQVNATQRNWWYCRKQFLIFSLSKIEYTPGCRAVPGGNKFRAVRVPTCTHRDQNYATGGTSASVATQVSQLNLTYLIHHLVATLIAHSQGWFIKYHT